MLVHEIFELTQKDHEAASERRDMETVARCSEIYDSLLNDAPDELPLLFACATAKMQLGRNGLAIALFEKCIRIDPKVAQVWNNLGTAYKAENKDDKARDCWERTIALHPHEDFYNNMTTLFVNNGNPQHGEKWADRGLKLDPNHARLHWNRSLILLEQGKWKEGFEEYEWGFKSGDRQLRDYGGLPEWDGKPGQRVIVYGEQGVGDEIMYASAIPDLMRDCEVIFDCHPRMVSLFERSFGVKCYGTRKDNEIHWMKHEKVDARVAVGSLFRHYRSDGKFPKTPYLKPDPELVAMYRSWLEALGDGPYIGIGWSAGTKGTRADLRSLKLKAFNDLIDHAGMFVSLQYTAGSAEKVARYKADTGREVHHWASEVETGPENEYKGFNYDRTVALIEALDLVIVPNTAAVHVCGAIGKECWTITPAAPAWRYQLSGDEMPMYGSVRQFRGGDAIERITAEYRNRWPWAKPALAAAG